MSIIIILQNNKLSVDLFLPKWYKIRVNFGGVAEWLKAAVLKTVKCKASWVRILPPPPNYNKRRNGRVAEGARLLSEYRCCYLSRVRISISPPLTKVL